MIFEGEYEEFSGEKNCKGREYDEDNKLIYEGEYIEGKRWIINYTNDKKCFLVNGKEKEYI